MDLEGSSCNNSYGLSQSQSSTNKDMVYTNGTIKTHRKLWGCKDSFVVQGDCVVQEGREIMERVIENLNNDESMQSSDDESISERDHEENASDVGSSISSYIW